jgi:hypothetical protein
MMRRIMMLMVVAALMVAMMAVGAGPASAATPPNPSCGNPFVNPPVPAGTDERDVSRPQGVCYNPTAEEPVGSGPNPNDNSVASQFQGSLYGIGFGYSVGPIQLPSQGVQPAANSFGLANSVLGNTIGSLGGLPTIPDPANSGSAPANAGSSSGGAIYNLSYLPADERSVTRPQSAIPDPANGGGAPANSGSGLGGGGSGMGGSIFNHQGSLP